MCTERKRKFLKFWFAVGMATLFTASLTLHAEQALRSPWDSHVVKTTTVAYSCPAIVHLPADLTTDGFYSDSKGSVIDPEKWKRYSETAGPMKELGNRLVAAADFYQQTGSRAAAECVIAHLDAAAKDGTLTGKMSSNQAYFVQGWVLGGAAIAYLKVRNSGVVTPQIEKDLFPWMKSVNKQTMDFYDLHRKEGKPQNNHLYWAGVEAAAVGIATNDRSLLDWAAGTYRVGINQINPDGSQPQEMRRGQRALHYHLYAVAPLTFIAEFGEVNGMHLYSEHNSALSKAVKLAAHGLIDNSFFQQKTGIPQDTPKGNPTAEEIGWATVYVHRFPDAEISSLIAKAPSLSYMYLGGLPPYVGSTK